MSPEGASLHLWNCCPLTLNPVATGGITYMMESALTALAVLLQMCFKHVKVQKEAQKAGYLGSWRLVLLAHGEALLQTDFFQ